MNRSDYKWRNPITGEPLSALSGSSSPDLTERIDAIAYGRKLDMQSSSQYAPQIIPPPAESRQLEQQMLPMAPKIKEYSPPASSHTPDYEVMKVLKAGFDPKAL